MTANHRDTANDNRRREQQSAGQQYPGTAGPPTQQPDQQTPQQRSMQQGQPIQQQSQPTQQPTQFQNQPTQQQGQPIQQQSQPTQRSTQQQGQPTQQQGQPTQRSIQQQGQPTQRSIQQQSQHTQQPTQHHPIQQGQTVQRQPAQQQPTGGQIQQAATGGQSGHTGGQIQQPFASGQQQQAAGGQTARGQREQPLLKPLRVNEIITEDVVTAEPDTPVQTVVAKMAEHDVGSVVVVEEDRPVGVITDRKVALALEETPDITQRTADELLHGDVFTADPSMSIFDAIQVMSDEEIRRLPIVDDDGTLRGIVTLDDALVLLGGVVSEVSETVQAQSPQL